MVVGHNDIFRKMQADLSSNKFPIAWFHCASLGEFEQGRPVIEAFKREFPKYKIVLTFFSPSGYEIRKNYEKADFIYYLPFDTNINAKLFIAIVKPKIAIFVKYEFWFNYIKQLQINKIPTYLISANFREKQIFFKNYGSFFKRILFNFTHIFVQNNNSEKLLQSIDYQNITLAGDTRFDRVFELTGQSKTLPIIEKFKGESKLFVIGSAWEPDINFLRKYINSDDNTDLKFVIAPHEIHENEIRNLQNSFKKQAILYSNFNDNSKNNVLIINNIGLLSSIYKYADYVWIGGAFGVGLHNILEAATYGKPIFFGSKNFTKFKEATDLVEMGGAFTFSDYPDFSKKINEFNIKPNYYLKTTEISKNYVSNNIGATEKIMNHIKLSLLA